MKTLIDEKEIDKIINRIGITVDYSYSNCNYNCYIEFMPYNKYYVWINPCMEKMIKNYLKEQVIFSFIEKYNGNNKVRIFL